MLRAAAQATAPVDQPEMADALRQSGKIYVVVAVITVVLAGLLFFLISLDRKLTRLEKEVRE
ncbi:CcmD family protein [Hymenobacter perfusus]|uniref:CcmD family protein n=2 Tax=Hymenobacter perfusus TaxID=1236770 RepID=A0A3R9MEI3_9BACT|nr:CcmD family protein [Hymenobacter perfusus]